MNDYTGREPSPRENRLSFLDRRQQPVVNDPRDLKSQDASFYVAPRECQEPQPTLRNLFSY